MSTSTIEQIDVVTTTPNKPLVWHRYSDIDIVKKVRGVPYKTLCGIQRKPNPNFKNWKREQDLAPIEKCVVCVMMWDALSQGNPGV